jgi:hypothetical protein
MDIQLIRNIIEIVGIGFLIYFLRPLIKTLKETNTAQKDAIESHKEVINSIKTQTEVMKKPFDMAMEILNNIDQIRKVDEEKAKQEKENIKKEYEDKIINMESDSVKKEYAKKTLNEALESAFQTSDWEINSAVQNLLMKVKYPLLIFAVDYLSKSKDEQKYIRELFRPTERPKYYNIAPKEAEKIVGGIIEGTWPEKDMSKLLYDLIGPVK